MNSESEASVGVGKQLVTCTVMCGLAVVVILLFHRRPYLPALLTGLPLFGQAFLGLAFFGLYWLSAAIGFKYVANRQATRSVTKSYSRLDLDGWNPFWIALAAGFGEELLFRGALQPLLGIYATSALFVLAHIKAYRLNAFNKRVLMQGMVLFALSIAFGYIAQYAGLITAMIVHAAMDIVGLYTIRRAAREAPAPAVV